MLVNRIFYIDLFSKTNSNFYWADAFSRVGVTQTFDTRESKEKLRDVILEFEPSHIHLGGSVKPGRSVNPALLAEVKRILGCGISSFYGDCAYSKYRIKLAEVVDYVYISNKTHVRINIGKGFLNFRYLPCPTEPRIFRYYPSKEECDLLFIGGNNDDYRRELLKRVDEKFDLTVAGPDWEDTGLCFLPPTYGKGFSILCGQAKIALGFCREAGLTLDGYFSNRLPNLLASRAFVVQTYSKGIENLFGNHKHLVWYKSESELFSLLNYYLKHTKERREIATRGQREILAGYTFDHHVRKMIKDGVIAGISFGKRSLRIDKGLFEDYIQKLEREHSYRNKKGG